PAVERALASEKKTFVSITAPVNGVDPCAVVSASRLASDRWFCWEQPDREFALAALGVAQEATSRGEGRFSDVARECLGGDRFVDEPAGLPAGAGAGWGGGLPLRCGGGSSPARSSFAPPSFGVAQRSICRTRPNHLLTLHTG